MSRHRRPLLICYDIADQKRLQKVFRQVRDVATPVQKSVFIADLTQAELDLLSTQLNQIVDVCEDCVQVFMLHDLEPPRGLWPVGISQSNFCCVSLCEALCRAVWRWFGLKVSCQQGVSRASFTLIQPSRCGGFRLAILGG